MAGRKKSVQQGETGRDLLSGTHELSSMRHPLLAWYLAHRRDLPWRRSRDPYAIWVSEIMLQQTRVVAVEERYRLFLRSFPTVASLAAASEDEVLALWSGLGYYRRARMLHKAAKQVVAEMGGAMPVSALGLRALPGIGVYTSAAVASIAFGEAIAVVDGNVERVVQRLAGWGSDTAPPAELAQSTARLAQQLLDPASPGDFNQAMMELGATVCLPRAPRCLTCPIRAWCHTRGEHSVAARAPMRTEEAAYALAVRSSDTLREVLLLQRAATETVMPGMWELPALPAEQIPGSEPWLTLRHAIMQVNYRIRIYAFHEDDAALASLPPGNQRWIALRDLATLPLTGLARKVLLRSKLEERLAEAAVAS